METDFGFRFHRPPPPSPVGNSHLDLMPKNIPLFPDSRLRATEQNVSQNQKNPVTGFAPARKRFLVFDQSGDKTTLMYTFGDRAPGRFGAYQLPDPPMVSNKPRDRMYRLRPDEDDAGDEMCEDTEELNALLCSDSDSDFSDDDEVTSTAHSPSTMTGGPAKRRKLYDGACSSHSAATSCLKSSGVGSDAESSCSNCNEQSSRSKRSRKEIIRGSLSILRTVIPDSEGKDAADVITEAICYLKSLKAKAAALGLDSV